MRKIAPKIGFKRTLRLMWSDFEYYCELQKKKKNILSYISFALLPGVIAVNLYRMAHYFYVNNIRVMSRPLYLLNIWITGADIDPNTQIDEGFLLLHSVATVIFGKFGKNVIVAAKTTIGYGSDSRDVGAGEGIPVIEDNVKIGANALILGGLVIGECSNIAGGSGVFKDVEPYSLVCGFPAKFIRKIEKDYTIF